MEKFIFGVFKYLHGIFVGGLLVFKYYFWFLLPVFGGLPQISYWQAIGLSAFLYLFQQVRAMDLGLQEDMNKKDVVKYGGFLIPWLVLGLGWLTHLMITTFGG